MKENKVAVVIGSLRKESYNRKMANALMRFTSDSLSLEIVEIGQLEMYNQDLDETPPESWVNFRNQLKTYNGFLFITPEYNRSVPGVLKNALDVGSRPYGKNAWDGKPGAVISVSPGAIGGFGANHHLRQSLAYLNVFVMAQPEAYIGAAATIFDNNGDLAIGSTREYMQKFMTSFSKWVDKNA